MNTDKENNSLRVDQKERGVVAGLQLKNAIGGAMDLSKGKDGKVAGCLNGMSNSLHTARNSSKIFDGVCKGINILSDWINPILILASMVRVYKSDDKKSAALREAGAMGAMLGAETVYKKAFGLGGEKAMYNNYKTTRNAAKWARTFCETNKYLSKLPTNQLTGLIKAVGFIITSCSAFALGGMAGQAVANRTTAVTYAKEHPSEDNTTEVETTSKKEFIA